MENAEIKTTQTNTTVLKGNAIFDGTGRPPFSGAVIIEGNKIVKVLQDGDGFQGITADGSCPGIPAGAEIIDCGDRLIMPGFNDAHTHITVGAFLEDENFGINLIEAGSKEECITQLKAFAEAHPDNEWAIGFMANNFAWENPGLPDRYDLDAAFPDRPAVIQMCDMHSCIVNSFGINYLNIKDDIPSPDDGVIEKDEKGVLTGRFIDGGGFIIMQAVYDTADEVYFDVYSKFFRKLASLGITACGLVAPVGIPKDPLAIFRQLDRDGALTARVSYYPSILEYDREAFAARCSEYNTGKIRIGGVKQLVDGVAATHTAYMLEPYLDAPDTCGKPSVDMDAFRCQVLNAVRDGVACRVHTIGDRAVREVLDIFEEAKSLYGDQGLRHVQEHIETVHPDDMGRFAEIGVACCMQPMHMVFDLAGDDHDRQMGPERCVHSWPMRELLDTGAVLALGSDFPIVEIDPLHEVYGAVARQTFEGYPEGGWYPDQRITMAETLKAYTYGSAYVEGCEDEFGTLEAGQLADVIVIDRNLFEIEPAEILQASVALTVSDGRIVYRA